MTAPIDPVPLAATSPYINPTVLATYENFYDLPPSLQGLNMQAIYIAPNGSVFHLAGPLAGMEGVHIGLQLQGEQHLPIEQVITESAYQFGATIERTNYPKRMINMRVTIGGNNYSVYQYQLCDQRWWAGQDELNDGWFGVYSRFSGWRWLPVRPFKTVDTAQKLDPTAYGNNMATWDVDWVAQRPYYTKPALWGTWFAAQSGAPNKAGQYTGSVTLSNRGDLQTWVQYIIKGAGVATVQDNNSTNMVALPQMFEADGPGLCDTNPEARTLTATSDPVDTEAASILAGSEILQFFLTNVTQQQEPWWQRGYVRFLYSVPPQSTVNFSVAHTNPNASITVILPQYFKRSR